MISVENASEWMITHHENIIGRGVYGTVFSLGENKAAKLTSLKWKNDLHSVLREIAVGNIGKFGNLNFEWCKTQKFHILGDAWSKGDSFHHYETHGMFAVTEMKQFETSVAKLLRVNRSGFNEEQTSNFLVEACGQTSTMMMSGVTPWDIKPDNVLFNMERCSFHICDFGISSVTLGMPRPEMCGTLWFRPIETILAEIHYDGWETIKPENNMELIEAGIVWQIGMTALNMLFGRNIMAQLEGDKVIKDRQGNETIKSFMERLFVRCSPDIYVNSLDTLIAFNENAGISLEETKKLTGFTRKLDHSHKLIGMITKMLRLNPLLRPSLRVVVEEMTQVGGLNWHESVVFKPSCSFVFGSKILSLPDPTEGLSKQETVQVVRLISLLSKNAADYKKQLPFGSVAATSVAIVSVVRALGCETIIPCCEGCAHNLVVQVLEIMAMLLFDFADFVVHPKLSKRRECECDFEIPFNHKLINIISAVCKIPECFAHSFFKLRVKAAGGRWELANQLAMCDDELICVLAELTKMNNAIYLISP